MNLSINDEIIKSRFFMTFLNYPHIMTSMKLKLFYKLIGTCSTLYDGDNFTNPMTLNDIDCHLPLSHFNKSVAHQNTDSTLTDSFPYLNDISKILLIMSFFILFILTLNFIIGMYNKRMRRKTWIPTTDCSYVPDHEQTSTQNILDSSFQSIINILYGIKQNIKKVFGQNQKYIRPTTESSNF